MHQPKWVIFSDSQKALQYCFFSLECSCSLPVLLPTFTIFYSSCTHGCAHTHTTRFAWIVPRLCLPMMCSLACHHSPEVRLSTWLSFSFTGLQSLVVTNCVPAVMQYRAPYPTQSKPWVKTVELTKLMNQWHMPRIIKYTKEGIGIFEFSLLMPDSMCN